MAKEIFKDKIEKESFGEEIKPEDFIVRKNVIHPMVKGGKLIFGSEDKCFKFEPDKGIWLGNADFNNAPFKVDMDGNLIAKSAQLINSYIVEEYEAGEDITAGKVVCFKPMAQDGDKEDNQKDAFLNERYADTNYGSEDEEWIGRLSYYDGNQTVYYNIDLIIKFLLPAEKILKEELLLYAYDTVGDGNTAPYSAWLVDAGWDESTITWNNAPGEKSFYRGSCSGEISISGAGWYAFDITKLLRYVQEDLASNYGIRLRLGSGTSQRALKIRTREWTDETYRPFLRIYTYKSDGKVYIADSSDYFLSRQVIGIALESKSAGQSIKIQRAGLSLINISSVKAGMPAYLDIDGELTYTPTSLGENQRILPVGYGYADGKLYWAPDYSMYWVDKDSFHMETNQTGGTWYFLVPDEAMRARFVVIGYSSSSDQKSWGMWDIYRNEDWSIYLDNFCWSIPEPDGSSSKWKSGVLKWPQGKNYITIGIPDTGNYDKLEFFLDVYK